MVEGAALEMLFTRKGNQGSNPCLSVLQSIHMGFKLKWYICMTVPDKHHVQQNKLKQVV